MSFGSLEGANIYFGLLGGSISSAQLDTLLSDPLTMGRFRHLVSVNSGEYKDILEQDSAVKATLLGSSVWQGLYVLSAAMFFDETNENAAILSFSSSTWSSGGASANTVEGTAATIDIQNQKTILKTDRFSSGELSKFSHGSKTFAVIAGTTGSQYLSGTGVFTSSVGYIAGGRPSTVSYRSDVTKIFFSSETTAATNSISPGRYGLHGSQTNTHGFWFSGNDSSSPYNSISRIEKSTDTINSQTAQDNANSGGYGVGKKSDVAYLINGSGVSRVDSYDMNTFTQAHPAASTSFTGGCAAIENASGLIYIHEDSGLNSYTYAPDTNTFAANGSSPSSLELNNSGVSHGAA